MTITELRKNIYRIFDEVAETGKQVEIIRKGKNNRAEQFLNLFSEPAN